MHLCVGLLRCRRWGRASVPTTPLPVSHAPSGRLGHLPVRCLTNRVFFLERRRGRDARPAHPRNGCNDTPVYGIVPERCPAEHTTREDTDDYAHCLVQTQGTTTEAIAITKAKLESMAGKVPLLRHLEVGVDVDSLRALLRHRALHEVRLAVGPAGLPGGPVPRRRSGAAHEAVCSSIVAVDYDRNRRNGVHHLRALWLDPAASPFVLSPFLRRFLASP